MYQVKKINLSYSFRWLKIFFLHLADSFSRREKIIMFLLAFVCIIFGAIFAYTNWIKSTYEIANYGGVYKEGMIINNNDDITDTINRLTKIGLTKFDNDGNIVGEVAESWEISDDVKTYTFKIKNQFSRDNVLKELEKQKDKWSGIQISPKDDDKVEFKFTETFSPFLASTTAPVLTYGPYKLVSKNSKEIKLQSNPDFYLGKAYLDEIIIKIYPDQENLTKAYKEKQIDGVYLVVNQEDYLNMNFYNFNLPRYNMVFFNTDRNIFKDSSIRKKIAQGEKLDNEIKAIVVALDSQANRKEIDTLIKKWEEIGLKIEVFYKNSSELINTVIPDRDYDILIYGLDYGYDPDPYPFWHSTQAGNAGFNLSNFSNIDADVLLEDARKIADKSKRDEIYEQFHNIVNEEAPAIILSQDQWTFGVSSKFQGINTSYSITPEDRFINIYKWYLKTKRVNKEN